MVIKFKRATSSFAGQRGPIRVAGWQGVGTDVR